MDDFNYVWLSGVVTDDPRSGLTADNIDALSFKMATVENRQDFATGAWRESTMVLKYVIYGSLAKIAAAEIRRGMRLSVEGKVTISHWNKGNGPQHRVQIDVRRWRVDDARRQRPEGEARRRVGA